MMASVVALWLENALQAFQILLQIGAGTGLVFLLRWFWWRINVWSELSAMGISFVVAVYFQFIHTALGFQAWNSSLQLVFGVAVTSIGWLSVTFLTPPVDRDTLRTFVTVSAHLVQDGEVPESKTPGTTELKALPAHSYHGFSRALLFTRLYSPQATHSMDVAELP